MKKQLIMTLIVLLLAITLAGAVSATVDPDSVKYVSPTGSDDNDGSELYPYLTIGKGITSVSVDGTVNVADGVYQEQLIIDKNVNLVGQSQENTILDGANTKRPLTIDTGVTVSISLFTIRNGRATGSYAYGGGILNTGNLTLDKCTIKNNQANPNTFYGSSYGGGIHNSGNLTLKGSTVEYNTGTGYYTYGGGIHNWGTMTIEDSTIQYNQAISSSDEAMGGGIYNENTLTIINSNINGNRAQSSYPDDAYGGGIYNRGALIMDNTNLEGNIASGYDAYGGGIYSYYGTLEIKNSTIHNNLAEASNTSAYGGGIYLNSGSLTLTNSNINQNTVTGQDGFWAEGGGIYNSGGAMTITGGSVSSNRVNGGSASGGGISSDGYLNMVTINGCTIHDNALYSTFTSNGGGIYNKAPMAINDSTIKGNTAKNGGGIYNYQSSLTITGSTIQENNAAIGAGIWNSGTTSISNSTITGNIASIQGGGIHHRSGTLTLTDTNIIHNTATTYGGGISNEGTLYIQNSAINDNTAQFGGGIFNVDREVILDSTEILRNTAADYNGNGARGGAIYNHYGAVTIDKSKINNNTAYSYTFVYGGGIYTYSGLLTITNSNFNHNTAAATSNVYGGGIYTYDSMVTMNFNRIVGNSHKTIYHSLDSQYGTVNAEYNWWGSNNPNFATLISGVVDYTPWLYMTFQADPTSIVQGETSTLTANFNQAFDGTTVTPLNPVDGHLPDGTLVTFKTDLGEVGSQEVDKPTTGGVAIATLNGTQSGLATVNAMLDGEELSHTVQVTGSEHNLVVNVTGQGIVNKNPDMASYPAGTVVTLTAVANPGWNFSHWTGDLTGNTNPQTITMDGDRSVTAVFVADAPETGIFTRLMVQDAAIRVRNFITSRGVLPNWVRMVDTAGTTHYVTMPVFLELSTASLISSANEFKALDVKTAPKAVGSTIVNRNLYKAGYMDMAYRVNKFIRNNGVAPNFAWSSLGNIRFQALVDSFARIVAFKAERKVLPNYVVINTRRVR
ncbi:hypothetical protein HYG87_00400 [Methanobacterium alkalithermotolerans]|uniref:Bacterial repeat domain-containing protein n=1 Tax=Methanobacterium alkalithermotolerans TaxID=2731220 RepID=A0A8T8K5D7_9EURY|nr:hypothetical protein [Methanobacterium alkalithermotolerans]QUH22333.1 hypothetical protein HYG87_00400 [Methanobacterium alkalithermotolerans]